ncbi:hypothetical protein F4678DRAFT_34261 [Xylaria arbuscula]|nr:hypothetical protein F4678DRAFT_34261 [Xylaria arbuscula]
MWSNVTYSFHLQYHLETDEMPIKHQQPFVKQVYFRCLYFERFHSMSDRQPLLAARGPGRGRGPFVLDMNEAGCKLSWRVRKYDKSPKEILERYGKGCKYVYVKVALFRREAGRQSSVLFIKFKTPQQPPQPQHPQQPLMPQKPQPSPLSQQSDPSRPRLIESEGFWHLPGTVCGESIFERLWAEVFCNLYVLLFAPSSAILPQRLTSKSQEFQNHKIQ